MNVQTSTEQAIIEDPAELTLQDYPARYLVVDEQDNPVWDQGKKKYVSLNDLFYGKNIHRSAHNILLDLTTDDMIVQLRPEDHFCVPGMFDFPCGGLVDHDETYESAAQRECYEETLNYVAVTELFGFYHEIPGIDRSQFKIFGGKVPYDILQPSDDCKELYKFPTQELTEIIGKNMMSPVFEKALMMYAERGINL